MSYEKPLRFRDQLESDKQKSLFFFSTIAFAFAFAVLTMIAGFMYGDYYGRTHSQYDNPKLREYYAGQCFNFINTNLKKTLKSGLEKFAPEQQSQRLDEIRTILTSLRMDLNGMDSAPRKAPTRVKDLKIKDSKKKVATAVH